MALRTSFSSLLIRVCLFQRHFAEADCTFREVLLADGYTRFLSLHHGTPVSLAPKRSPDQHTVPFTRFLPLRNTLAEESVSEPASNRQGYFNMDSDDLLGMGLNVMISPQFSVDKWQKNTRSALFAPFDTVSLFLMMTRLNLQTWFYDD